MIKSIRKYRLPVITFIIGLISVFSISFLSRTTYTAYMDYLSQNVPFYNQFHYMWSNGIPFWSWNMFGGLNYYSSASVDLLGDIFAYFTLLFPQDKLELSMMLMLFIKLALIYLFSYLLMNKYWKLSNLTSSLFSLLFAFCEWNALFFQYVDFTSIFVWTILILIGIEKVFKNENPLVFIIAVFLLMTTDYYLAYCIAWYMALYTIVRGIYYDYKINTKRFITFVLKLIGYFFIGVGLASFIWLPSVIFLMQSERTIEFGSIAYSLKTLGKYLWHIVCPSPVSTSYGIYRDGVYTSDEAGIFIGVISTLLIPHFHYVLERKERIISYILLAFNVVVLSFPFFSILFHISPSMRYTIFITLNGLYIASRIFENRDKLKLKWILISEGLFAFVYILVKYVLINFSVEGCVLNQYDWKLLTYALILSIIYTFVLLIKKKEIKTSLLYVVVFVELIVLIRPIVYGYDANGDLPYKSEVYSRYSDFRDALKKAKEIQSDLDRIYIADDSITNQYLLENVSGVSLFDSIYQYPANDLYHNIYIYPEINWQDICLIDSAYFELFNVNCLIINKTQHKLDDSGFTNSENLELYYENNKYAVYKINKNYSFAHTVLSVSNVEDKPLDEYEYIHEEIRVLVDTPIVSNDDYQELKDIYSTKTEKLEVNDYSNNHLTIEYDLDEDSLVMLSMLYDSGWKAYIDNQETKVYKCDGGMVLLNVPKGRHIIELKFIPKGFELGVTISIVSLALLIALRKKLFIKQF